MKIKSLFAVTNVIIRMTNAIDVSLLQQKNLYKFIQQTHYDDNAILPLSQILMVRLGYQSCFGPQGCQGCIPPSTIDRTSTGLDHVIQDLYDGWKKRKDSTDDIPDLSFADYLNAACLKAVEDLTQDSTVRSYTTYGRQDCPEVAANDSPFFETFDPSIRANPNLSWKHVYQKFHTENFQLTVKEIVALIGGGHSIGQISKNISGWPTGQWDDTPSKIDARFFDVLVNLKWVRDNATNPDKPA